MSLHFIDGEGLLLDREHHRLYALNASATLIWCMLEDGAPPAEICRLLNEQYAVSANEAASYVSGILDQCASLSRAEKAPAAPQDMPIQAGPGHRLRSRHAEVIATYALLGSVIRVRYDNARLHDAVHPLLQHGALARATPTIVIDIVPHGDGVAIIADDLMIGWSWTLEDAAVAVRACLTQVATAKSGGLCVVHAGALSRNGGALLLPGDAGYGKSTLSAGLAARGFDMLCDDTTLLAGDPPLVRCLPTGLCIKRGAYAVLEPLHPHLAGLREWRRPDGKHARYLMPGRDLGWAPVDAAVAARWMVFPRYHPDQGTSLLPLRRHAALARLLPGVCFLSGHLDPGNLDRLIAWIERIDCYDLPLSSLDDATTLIDGLCR
ncbi:MAG: PqqD family peptide modification chaperone [Reyranella sp.]|uniref:PqqD family peptide modification chaperone n=1 Tax=Reyranella sp. TaxID=1929291 RepID=UPI003D150DC9